MVATLELIGEQQVSSDIASLAASIQQSVVAVRGSRQGSGSGVVWGNTGMVLTNHHVVRGDYAEILTPNGQRTMARVIRRAPQLDLVALIPDHNDDLIPCQVGDSKRLRIGQLVLAVGNPLGERNAVTLGMVTSLGSSPWLQGHAELIQASLTLRPGNSGGALANIDGRVVGIPNMVLGGDLGVSIPSHVVQAFLGQELGSRV